MLNQAKINIFLIEDEEYDVRRIKNTIKPFESRVHIRDSVSDGHSAVELLEMNPQKYDVVIMDFQIAGGLKGEKLIRRIKEIDATLQIIVVTKMTMNITDYDFANQLLEAGAMWYCTKYPGDIEDYIYQPTDFMLSIFNAYEKKRLEKEKRRSVRKLNQNLQEILRSKQIVGQSPSIRKLYTQVERSANSEAVVLIQGGSGTGKELVAANIHYQSGRRFEKFVPINCASLPGDLIESELFGFEKGSFTGATANKQGLLEVAHKGTAFLDEIAELPLNAQVKLLRFLQEGELDKIGRTDKLRVDVRIIAATNKNLEEEIRAKSFREDLFYRLNVINIRVPNLRERPEDIPLLVQYFMKNFSRDMGRDLPELEPSAMEMMKSYAWPGNVRELQNVVQRLLLYGDHKIGVSAVEQALSPIRRTAGDIAEQDFLKGDQILPLREMEKKVREKYFRMVRANSGSDSEAARKMGLAPPNYYRMCKELGLK
ncbi:MAG: sigma-54 dependent transcriptional regulator [Calditrichia bacterium]